jgi:hypothetical protein
MKPPGDESRRLTAAEYADLAREFAPADLRPMNEEERLVAANCFATLAVYAQLSEMAEKQDTKR